MKTLIWKVAAVALATLIGGEALAQDRSTRSSRSAGARAQERQTPPAEQRQRGAQTGRDRPAADSAALQAQQRTRGQAEAPAVAQGAGVACQIADALYLGSSGTAPAQQSVYEVACTGGLGYVLVSRPPQPTQVVDCLSAKTVADREEAAGTGRPIRCTLPANANPAAGLQPVVQRLGRACTITNGRALGAFTGGVRYEVACQQGGALVIDAPGPGSTTPATALTCLQAASSSVACEYETRDQMIAAIRPRLTGPAAACQVSGIRFAGRPTQRQANEVVEVACGAAGGFLIESDPQARVVNTWTCGSAEARGIDCELTNTTVAQTQDIGDYAASARAIGLNCAVTGYRRVGADRDTGREVVELVCPQQPGGVVAFFPIPGRPNQTGETIDCLRAEARNIGCRLTPLATSFPSLTQQLAAAGQTCPVSAVRRVGRLEQEDFIEVACDPSRRGFFVALPVNRPTGIGRVLRCVEARELGGCTLPGNAAGDRPRT